MHRHKRFVRTPVIHDVLHLQCYQRGQWVQLAWSDRPSRYWGTNPGASQTVIAFHYPTAHRQFCQYNQLMKQRRAA